MNIKSKKYYSAPIVNSIRLDRSIVLLEPTGNPPGGNIQVEPPATFSTPASAPPSTNNTPFGGNSPDYSDM